MALVRGKFVAYKNRYGMDTGRIAAGMYHNELLFIFICHKINSHFIIISHFMYIFFP